MLTQGTDPNVAKMSGQILPKLTKIKSTETAFQLLKAYVDLAGGDKVKGAYKLQGGGLLNNAMDAQRGEAHMARIDYLVNSGALITEINVANLEALLRDEEFASVKTVLEQLLRSWGTLVSWAKEYAAKDPEQAAGFKRLYQVAEQEQKKALLRHLSKALNALKKNADIYLKNNREKLGISSSELKE